MGPYTFNAGLYTRTLVLKAINTRLEFESSALSTQITKVLKNSTMLKFNLSLT